MAHFKIRSTLLIPLLVATFVAAGAARRFRESQIQKVDWNVVPYRIGSWQGQPTQLDPLLGDPADTSLVRLYEEPGSPPITFYVGFHKTLPVGIDVHTPAQCYPSQGWQILSQGTFRLARYAGRTIEARDIMVTKNGEQQMVVWWYQTGSRVFDARIRHVYELIVRALVTGRTDGVVVEIGTPVVQPGGKEEAQASISSFTKLLLPHLERALPQ